MLKIIVTLPDATSGSEKKTGPETITLKRTLPLILSFEDFLSLSCGQIKMMTMLT